MCSLIYRCVSLVAVLCLLLVGSPPAPAHADALIVVNTAADQDNGVAMISDGFCGLREAINNANSTTPPYMPNPECAPGSAGTDMITFVGNYTITLGLQNQLLVTSPINIRGNGAANTIIEADPTEHTSTYRVFQVDSPGDLTLDSLTVRNGQCAGSCVDSEYGGGVYNTGGSLTIKDSTFQLNKADFGGGVWSHSGTLRVINSTFRENIAVFQGGGIDGDSTSVRGSTFSANAAYESGGGIFGAGNLSVTNSTLSANAASQSGGGIFMMFGTLTMRNSTLSGNGASTGGGGIYLYGSKLNYSNTIIANSVFGDCGVDLGYVSSLGTNINNLVEDGMCGAALFGDPNLGPLDYYGGTTRTHSLLPGSPAIDAGNDTICAGAAVNNLDQRGVVRPQGTHCDIGAFEVPQTTVMMRSLGSLDGWVLESGETSGVGGTLNATAEDLRLGDEADRKQYRAMLSFSTAGLPDDAVITSATLRLRKRGQVGNNPFASLGNLRADVKTGPFGSSTALQLADFKAGASGASVLSLGNNPSGTGWYSGALAYPDLQYINTLGTTQFRMRFSKDDNNNTGADYLRIYSGNAASGSRPQLILTYYVP